MLFPGLAAVFLASVFFLLHCPTHAQIFMCKDAAGHTLTSDRPIPECSNRAVRELSKSGLLKREIAAPLTKEQKQQQLALEEKRKAEEALLAEQKERDRTLIARFSSVAAIESARKRTRDLFEDKIAAATVTITELEKDLKKTDAEAAVSKNKPVAPNLLRRREEIRAALAAENDIVKKNAAEIAETDARFDEMVKRYKEITQPAKSP